MLRYKHMKLDQEKIDRAKRILKARAETEVMDKALDKVLQKDVEGIRKKKIMKRMIQLRKDIGRVREDSAEWVRLGRSERMVSHGSRS